MINTIEPDILNGAHDNQRPVIYSFESLSAAYPKYLSTLKNHTENLFNTYLLIHDKHFVKIRKMSECYETAQRCGFGMLMRHALEAISTSLATENGIDVGGRSVFERLDALKGQELDGFNSEKKAVLSKLLDLTNEIAHPHVLDKHTSFSELKSFYDHSFKPVLDSYILNLETLVKATRANNFGISKYAKVIRNQSLGYLKDLRKHLEKFNIFSNMTNILIQGCLVRQLTECTVNRWAYNTKTLPTDVSTYQNQIGIASVLEELNRISKATKRTAFGTSGLTSDVVTALYKLKNASNPIMHIEKFASDDLSKQGQALSQYHDTVLKYCGSGLIIEEPVTPASEQVKRKIPREKSPAFAALLCGLLGFTGAHHFYLGNIIKGIIYLPFCGFIIAPAIDLFKMLKGKLRNPKGGFVKKTPFSALIALVFFLIHAAIIFSLLAKAYSGEYEFINRLKEYKFDMPIVATVEKCDATELEVLTKIGIADSSSSSFLKTSKRSFDSSLCIDSNSSTCWQDGVEGNGEGESLTFVFHGTEPVSGFSILNGKQTNENAFFDNARVHKLDVKIGSKTYNVVLDDEMTKQSFRLKSPKEAEEISITITSAYDGNKWQDLCISEVEFYKE